MAFVSVVIPTYNRLRLVKNAIESVKTQTINDIEIILVDDGSTDGTKEFFKGLNDPNIKYFHQENQGVASARNVGLNASSGQFIAFLDSDDEWLPTKIEKQLAVFNENPDIGLVYCGSEVLNEVGGVLEVRHCDPRYRGEVFKDLAFKNFIPTPTVMIRREIVERVGFMLEELKFGEDWHYWLKIAANSQVGFVNEVLVRFRQLKEGLTSSDCIANASQRFLVLDEVFERSEEKNLLEGARRKIFAYHHYDTSQQLLWNNYTLEARAHCLKSIRLDPWDVRKYFLFFKTFSPYGLVGRKRS